MPDTLSPLQSIARDLRADREVLRAAVDAVPPALRATRPAPDRWSVAEILEHVAMVETRTATMLDARLAEAPPRDTSAQTAPTPFDRLGMRDRTRPFPAPDFVQPTGAAGGADAAWAALEQTWRAIDALLAKADGLDLAAVTRQHPALGHIDGYQWLTSLGGHALRHAEQIREIGEALGASA